MSGFAAGAFFECLMVLACAALFAFVRVCTSLFLSLFSSITPFLITQKTNTQRRKREALNAQLDAIRSQFDNGPQADKSSQTASVETTTTATTTTTTTQKHISDD